MAREQRFSREGVDSPRLAPAPSGVEPTTVDVDVTDLLRRLEHQAAELGRLQGRVETLERALANEREGRRRLANTLKSERRAAESVHERAQQEAAGHAAAQEELAQLREAAVVSEQQTRLVWTQLAAAERELAWKGRSFWRKLLRRPPAR